MGKNKSVESSDVEPIVEASEPIISETLPEAPKEKKSYVIYSKYFGAQLSKLLKSTRPQGLKFDNGVAIVNQEELDECKKSQYWNKSISDKKFIDQKPPVRVTTDKEK